MINGTVLNTVVSNSLGRNRRVWFTQFIDVRWRPREYEQFFGNTNSFFDQ